MPVLVISLVSRWPDSWSQYGAAAAAKSMKLFSSSIYVLATDLNCMDEDDDGDDNEEKMALFEKFS